MSDYEDKDLRHAMDYYFMENGTIDGFTEAVHTAMSPNSTNIRSTNMATATKAVRSEFFGVYNTNPAADYAKQVPYRVALRIIGEGDNEDRWINGGFFKTQQTAARVYNMMAIRNWGKDAVINDIGKPTKAQNQEFADYLNANPARGQMYKVTAVKAKALINEFGKFTTHKDIRVADAQVPEVDGVL